MRIAVLGLGEAGSLIAADLAAAGADVVGFDPGPVATPAGVTRCDGPEAAVAGADLVLTITTPDHAGDAFAATLDATAHGAVYADLTTSPPAEKAERAERAAGAGRRFADVALMAPVPGRGLGTPALASGAGAERYAAALNPLGAAVEVIGPHAGDATTRKLLRSVTMKGLAAIVIEALRAADAAGLPGWLWGDLVAELTAADEKLLVRLVEGTGVHAARRVHEMEACAAMLESLGVDPVMTRATVASLRRAVAEGVPAVPGDSGVPAQPD